MKLEESKVFIIGLGQIGGSIARALIKNSLVENVCGYDIDESVGKLAEKSGYINNLAESVTDGIGKADIIIIATPIRTTIKLIPEIIKQARSDQTILDVAGIQFGILEIVSRQNSQTNYISGHPIAGNEGTGLDASSIDKFNNSVFFISPEDSAQTEWVNLIIELIKALGAVPVTIDPQKHDRLISMTINLPYILAQSLINLAAKQEDSFEDIWQLAGGSFKGATRVALSSPELTLDMFLTNRDNILNIINECQIELTKFAELISSNDEDGLRKRIEQAKTQKEYMNRVQDG